MEKTINNFTLIKKISGNRYKSVEIFQQNHEPYSKVVLWIYNDEKIPEEIKNLLEFKRFEVNFIEVYDIWVEEGKFYACIEYFEHLDLKSFKECMNQDDFSLESILHNCSRITACLATLHQQNFSHNNMKSSKIFVNSDKIISLAGLKLAKLEKIASLKPRFKSEPEILIRKTRREEAFINDIRNLGIIFCELLSVKFSKEMPKDVLLESLKKGFLRFGQINEKFLNLVFKMLTFDNLNDFNITVVMEQLQEIYESVKQNPPDSVLNNRIVTTVSQKFNHRDSDSDSSNSELIDECFYQTYRSEVVIHDNCVKSSQDTSSKIIKASEFDSSSGFDSSSRMELNTKLLHFQDFKEDHQEELKTLEPNIQSILVYSNLEKYSNLTESPENYSIDEKNIPLKPSLIQNKKHDFHPIENSEKKKEEDSHFAITEQGHQETSYHPRNLDDYENDEEFAVPILKNDSPSIFCIICENKFIEFNSKCTHCYDLQCFKEYIKQKLENFKSKTPPIKCFSKNCRKIIPFDFIMNHFQKDEKIHYLAAKLFYSSLSFICVCGEISGLNLLSDNFKSQEFFCKKCQMKFCTFCGVKAGHRFSCDLWNDFKKNKIHEEKLKKLILANLK
jgi:hypothetical protein